MKSYLESRGVWCKTLVASDVDGRTVLYAATVPELKNPDYALVTHLDVVAAASSEMFKPRLEGNKLFARGACGTRRHAQRKIRVVHNRQNYGIIYPL